MVSGAGLGRAGVGVGVCMGWGGVSQSSQGTCQRQGWEAEGLWVWEHFQGASRPSTPRATWGLPSASQWRAGPPPHRAPTFTPPVEGW